MSEQQTDAQRVKEIEAMYRRYLKRDSDPCRAVPIPLGWLGTLIARLEAAEKLGSKEM